MDFSVLEPHLFRNAQLYAPEDLGHCDLLIAGGKIVAVEKAGHATTRPDCPESDLAGAVVCPGFIDQHVHLIGGGGEAGPHTRTPEVRLSALVAAGITSVVGLLGTDGVTRHPESLLAKTRALEHEGISTWMLTGAYGLPSPTITGSIEKDVALIDKIIGVKCAISDHRSSAPADDQLANMAAQSRVGGLLGAKAGISVFHLGNSPKLLEPLLNILNNADVPRTKLLPTHVNRAQALFHAALDYAREGGTSTSPPASASLLMPPPLSRRPVKHRCRLTGSRSARMATAASRILTQMVILLALAWRDLNPCLRRYSSWSAGITCRWRRRFCRLRVTWRNFSAWSIKGGSRPDAMPTSWC